MRRSLQESPFAYSVSVSVTRRSHAAIGMYYAGTDHP